MNVTTQQTQEAAAPSALTEQPNGPAAAAILSAGIGSCMLALLALAGDASKTIARWLTFYRPTGPLSGVSSLAILVWLAAWFILSKRWSMKTIAISKTNAIAFVLLAVALLLTFPPFEDLLLGK